MADGYIKTAFKRTDKNIIIIITEQFRQSRIFDLDQKKIYVQLNRNEIRLNDVPNAEECTKFWGNIWGVRKEHNREAEWLNDLKRESKC